VIGVIGLGLAYVVVKSLRQSCGCCAGKH
jgi:hypothetical protein